MNVKKKRTQRTEINLKVSLIVIGLSVLVSFFLISSGVQGQSQPDAPSDIAVAANETNSFSNGSILNISGGRIATINITANVQNQKWKGFVGNVSGSFTLDDAGGSTLYDWSFTTVGGEVYATRNSSTILWSNIRCTNLTFLETENTDMGHSSPDDNITVTFNNGINGTHDEFFVAGTNISTNSCPTLNTYVNSASQDASFEEIALTDDTNFTDSSSNIIYATILEEDITGFDGATYDFQMIVPERGEDDNTVSTAYYLYVELT